MKTHRVRGRRWLAFSILPILILMVLVILAGAAVGGLYVLKTQGIEVPHLDKLKTIPYIGEFLVPEEKGAVEAIQSSITSDFINNQSAARKPIMTVGIAAITSTAGLISSRNRGRANWLV